MQDFASNSTSHLESGRDVPASMRKMLPIAGPLIAILSAILIIRIVETGSASNDNHLELRLLTVATEATDGFNRFNRSAHVYGVRVEVLGMGSEWRGGDVSRYPGGAHKLILLRRALQQYKNEEKMVILFTDRYA